MKRSILAAALALIVPAFAGAQAVTEPDTALKVGFGGFVDSYYGYDFGRPVNIDRAFTTQAARHNEFNVNLAYLDATLTGPRVRGRFAAQFGTSVQVNTAGEPRIGSYSGPELSRLIQEAYAGYRVTPTLWVDGGIMLMPFGTESFISRDNWNYTRTIIAENVPYYGAGVRAIWQATPAVTAQLHLMNGWQNISETNEDKSLGARVDWVVSPGLTLAYDGFLGNDQRDSVDSRIRFFNEVYAQLTLSDRVALRATLDHGTQERANGNGSDNWNGYSLLARLQATPKIAVAGRFEGYSDPDQVIVGTGQDTGLRATGGSVNVDVIPISKFLWRTELRFLKARDPLFPDRDAPGGLAKDNTLLVTSLALTF